MTTEAANKSRIPEWIVVLAITFGAICLRGLHPGRLGIDHFDEGIYATAGTWSLRPSGLSGIDPRLIPYAPPGYPILVGLAYAMIGPSDFAAIAVSILAGAATIPLVGLLGRRTIGPGGGVAAATFAALSGIHLVFSRMALTDATMLFSWIGAVGLGGRFLERPGPWRAVGLGLAVGLAQAVKYNGWLVGAIVAATAIVGPLGARHDRAGRRLAVTLGWGLVAILVSGLVTLPWFLFVERHGGYAALLAHQRSYLGGRSDWTMHLVTQLHQVVALGGMPFLGSLTFAIAFGGFWLTSPKANEGRLQLVPVLVACVAMILFAPATAGWWLGLAVVPWTIVDPNPRVRLLAVWWLVLTILTPFYHPYARLWLPLEAVGWMMQARVVVSIAEVSTLPGKPGRDQGQGRAAVGVLSLLAAAIQSVGLTGGGTILPDPIGPRDSLRVAAARIASALPPGIASVSMLGRPSVGFYLAGPLASRRVGLRVVETLEHLEAGSPDGWAIVDTAQFHQEGGSAAGRIHIVRNWSIVAEEPTTLSPATLLDIDPDAVGGDVAARTAPLLLIRRKPKETKP